MAVGKNKTVKRNKIWGEGGIIDNFKWLGNVSLKNWYLDTDLQLKKQDLWGSGGKVLKAQRKVSAKGSGWQNGNLNMAGMAGREWSREETGR